MSLRWYCGTASCGWRDWDDASVLARQGCDAFGPAPCSYSKAETRPRGCQAATSNEAFLMAWCRSVRGREMIGSGQVCFHLKAGRFTLDRVPGRAGRPGDGRNVCRNTSLSLVTLAICCFCSVCVIFAVEPDRMPHCRMLPHAQRLARPTCRPHGRVFPRALLCQPQLHGGCGGCWCWHE